MAALAQYVCPACGLAHDAPGRCPTDGEPLALASDPMLGATVGRYRVARLLGAGGMGRVYLGVPAPTNLVVPPHHFADDTTIVVGVDPQGAA